MRFFLKINKKYIALCVCIFLFLANGFAQDNSEHISKADSLAQCEKESEEVDVVDVYRMVIKKHVEDSCAPSKKAGKLHMAFLPAVGYSLVTKIAGVVAANGAFYSDNEGNTKLSAVNTSVSYTQNNQIILPILSNIWTKENKYNLLGDWRFYKYPEYTYGLGGHTSLKNSNQLNYSCIIIHEAVLKHIYNSSVYAGLAYNLNYHWNIHESGYPDGTVTDFQKYGKTAKSVSSGISFNALYDDRKNSINSTKAFYSSIAYCPNLTILGSDHNYQSLIIDVRKYFKPSVNSENILAFWSYNWFTFNGNAPYLDLPSTAWDPYSNLGRGYIQSRLRGKNLLYLEAEYRFKITRNGLFGGVVFANAQSVTDWPSNRFQVIYPAVGTGIRIKINKHSGTNLAIDYAIGINGSNGVFINLGEVF
ncbi:MAG TPA: hypothetical protein VK835_05705 [Bacteroidia bacterium]|jgi:hypothetical protein|nr:hypothetical protein [Bacteroidia bacterium]